MKPRVQGAAGPVNTLGGTGTQTRPKRQAVHRPLVDPPRAAKRPKPSDHTEARFELNTSSLPNSIPRSEHHGSQDGVSTRGTGMTGEPLDPTASTTRSNRRTRQGNTSQSPSIMATGRSRPLFMPKGQDDIVDDVDDTDELANETIKPPRRNLNLAAAGFKMHGRIAPDGADMEIMAPKAGANTTKKRPIQTATGDDELGDCRQAKKTAAGAQAQEIAPRKSVNASLSSRADIPTTSWSKGSEGFPRPPRVVSAVCPPRFVYQSPSTGCGEDSQLCLQSGGDGDLNLYAWTAKGQLAIESRWLKITGSTAKSLVYDPDGPYIKVLLRLDPREHTGALLALQFADKDEACEVATWAKTRLNLQVSLGTTEFLEKTLQHKSQEVVAFNNKPKPPAAPAPAAPQNPITITMADGLGHHHNPPKTLTPRPPLLRDRMQRRASNPVYNAAEPVPEPPSTRRSTRSSGNIAIPIRVEDDEPEIARWSEHNTDWAEDWKVPLVFQRTTVDKEDIPRLDEGECLNDNLIGFFMRHIFDQVAKRDQNLNQRVYVHNTFFYTKLKSNRSYDGKINYDGVKNWTSKVDLLSYDYVIVPVNEHFHWWMAIICNPGKLDRDAREQSADIVEDSSQAPGAEKGKPTETGDPGPSPEPGLAHATDRPSSSSPNAALPHTSAEAPKNEEDTHNASAPSEEKNAVDLVEAERVVSDLAPSDRKPVKRGRKSHGPPPRVYDLKDPRIITLDSLGASHSPAVVALKSYLCAEFEHKRNKVLEDLPAQLGMKAVGLPEQDNFCDCGVYLLAYFQEFVRDPDNFVRTLLRKEKLNWEMEPSSYRDLFRGTILNEQKRYQDSLGQGKVANRSTVKTPNKTPVRTTNKSPVKAAESVPGRAAPPAQKPSVATTPEEAPKAKVAPQPAFSPGRSSKTLRASSSPSDLPGAWPDEDGPSGDEVVLLQPSNDVALPSVESAPPPPEAVTTENVTFLSKLPSSSPPRGPRRLNRLRPSPMAKKEQPRPKPATVLASTSSAVARPQTRSVQNSPASTRPKPTAGMSASPYFSPRVAVVRNATLDTGTDDTTEGNAIDLTEDAVETRKKKDDSIDLTQD